jgi:hypothetical protein
MNCLFSLVHRPAAEVVFVIVFVRTSQAITAGTSGGPGVGSRDEGEEEEEVERRLSKNWALQQPQEQKKPMPTTQDNTQGNCCSVGAGDNTEDADELTTNNNE